MWGAGLINGLRISFRNMLRGPITVQYPRQKLVLPERARWAVQMKLDDEGNHKCTGCLACEKACPDYIIELALTTDEQRNKHIDRWHYEIGACMMCGLCVEACPFDAIEQGHDYELARFSAEELAVDLLVDTPVAKPKRAERPAPAPKPAAEAPAGDAETTTAVETPASTDEEVSADE